MKKNDNEYQLTIIQLKNETIARMPGIPQEPPPRLQSSSSPWR
jgi:hypothetical protein